MQRTQIYLTEAQRAALDREAKRSNTSLAEVIRRAIDRFIGTSSASDSEQILAETAGSMPDLEVPNRREWDRGYN